MQAIVVPVFTFEIVVVVGLVNLIDALRGLLDEPQPATKPTAATNPDARTTFTLGNHRRFVPSHGRVAARLGQCSGTTPDGRCCS